MELQLIREALRLEQPLGTGRATAMVTGEVTLPGGLREETRVLAVHATASADSAEAATGRVDVRGRVAFCVLYTQGDPTQVKSVEATADFLHPCEMRGAQPRAEVQAFVQAGRAEARATGGRMSLRAEVDIGVSAASLSPVEAVTAVEGADDVQVLARPQTIRRTVALGSGEKLLREELPLPEGLQITQTLGADAYAVVEAITGGVGRVGLSGQVLLEAAHASRLPGRPVTVTRHAIPFTQSVELSGEEGETLDGSAVVKDVAVALQEDESGQQTLRAEVLLGLEGRAEAEETLSVLQDAYTTDGDEVRLTGETILCRTGGKAVSAAESARVTLRLPPSAPPVRQVLAAFARPQETQRETQEGRTTLSGTMDATLLYMTDGSDAPASVRLSEPFRVTFAQETAVEDFIALAATDTEAVPVTSDRVELRCILRMQARTQQAAPLRLVTGGETVPAAPVTEDMVLCFAQPGEGLWDIARRYRTPVSAVEALNPGLRGDVQPGQGVVVWRRCGAGCL